MTSLLRVSTLLLALAAPLGAQGSGSIRGTVRLKGGLTTAARMDVTQDKPTCGKSKPFPCLAVGKNAGVANTFIRLADRGIRVIVAAEQSHFGPGPKRAQQ